MPPLESLEMTGETIETPPSSKTYEFRRQQHHGTMAGWTTALLQYGTSFRSFSGNQEPVVTSTPAAKVLNAPSSDNHRQRRPSVSPPSSGDSDHRKHLFSNSTPRSFTPNVKRKKGPTAALFTYVVVLSILLLAYTEYQLWQLSEMESLHSNILTRSNETRTSMKRLGISVANETTMKQEEEEDHDKEQGDSVEEEDTILHIIHSRFMQNQPNLLYLGEARLHLLQHFFLHSLEEQSSKNFCCIIRTDPELHPSLREQLVEMLQASNITYILVASNDTPKSQYQDLAQGNIQPADVWSGSLEAIQQYLRLANTTTTSGDVMPSRIIETRLDADDGLHRYFVETIQAEADSNYRFEPRSWRLWCVANHVEWQYQTIWNESPSVPQNDTGTIVALQVNYCVTPGLSIAFLGDDQSLETMPSTMNHEKLMHTRMCKQNKKVSSDCRSFVPMSMGALRARTPTSAGMLNLVYNGTSMNRKYIRGASKQKDIQGQLWWAVRKFFGFTKSEASSINEYLNGHMKMIAEENLLGQCTKGHSCKNSSHILLKSIVEGSS